jgi:hypothetical protein
LNKTLAKEYSVLKSEVGIVSDFCIHFEDDDGKVVDLDDSPCWVQYSIGDFRLNLTLTDLNNVESSIPCGNRTYVC